MVDGLGTHFLKKKRNNEAKGLVLFVGTTTKNTIKLLWAFF